MYELLYTNRKTQQPESSFANMIYNVLEAELGFPNILKDHKRIPVKTGGYIHIFNFHGRKYILFAS